MKKVKYFIMDVDGTLTDGKLYIGNNGELFKAFDIKDGCGIKLLLIPAGIEPIIITGRESEILKIRCQELGITKLYQGVSEKLLMLEKLFPAANYNEISYIGDDINDLSCMKKIKSGGGLIACPADAVREVQDISDFVSSKNGGNGAVREFIEFLVKK